MFFSETDTPEEAKAYINFIFDRVFPKGLSTPIISDDESLFLSIMLTIRGDYEIPRIEPTHLDGYKGSKLVQVGKIL